MLFENYLKITKEIAQAVDEKDYETPIRLLNELIQSDLPDLDKSVMCINKGVVWDKRGNSLEALRWYDSAIRYEKPYQRFFAQEEKAAYLIRLRREEEALVIYQDLLTKSFLTLSDQERVRANLGQIERK